MKYASQARIANDDFSEDKYKRRKESVTEWANVRRKCDGVSAGMQVLLYYTEASDLVRSR